MKKSLVLKEMKQNNDQNKWQQLRIKMREEPYIEKIFGLEY